MRLFCSSSTPRGSPSGGQDRGFRPTRGKKNRMQNWERFGNFNQQQQGMEGGGGGEWGKVKQATAKEKASWK
jgi:hypothetical protein